MPLRRWGKRVLADLNWQGPKMISRNRTPRTLPGYNGVYLISSRHVRYQYPHGQSSLAYIGSGRVEDRLHSHVGRNRDLIEHLDAEGTMWFWYHRGTRWMARLHRAGIVRRLRRAAWDQPHAKQDPASVPQELDRVLTPTQGNQFPLRLCEVGLPRGRMSVKGDRGSVLVRAVRC